jgi:glycine dehydrogenase subunit 1
MERLEAVGGVRLPYAGRPHVREFVVDLSPSGRTVSDVNRALLERGILGGLDQSRSMPWLGQALLVAIDETKTQADIDRLAGALAEVLR